MVNQNIGLFLCKLALDLFLLLGDVFSMALWRRNCGGPNLRNNWDRGSRLCFSGSSVKLAIYSGHARLCLCVYTVNTYSKDDVTLVLIRGKYSVFNTESIQLYTVKKTILSRVACFGSKPTPYPLSRQSARSVTHVTQEDCEREPNPL
jgi:hypothetical protein